MCNHKSFLKLVQNPLKCLLLQVFGFCNIFAYNPRFGDISGDNHRFSVFDYAMTCSAAANFTTVGFRNSVEKANQVVQDQAVCRHTTAHRDIAKIDLNLMFLDVAEIQLHCSPKYLKD